ncbi:aromatic acid exporter family protein [Clostridium ganghwense]|uniref:Aromatic acid exporter family protein n=1 Tax=Clostridium ganghwense TaxID=312089 RepID=A0ABT4CJN4_9CLOT|nr:aromatic acid exporter family protein [Clostridium ganghwense]MCY6369260.1 aromatic acid exporter family protein [Clostridium ganghwense]
MKFIGYRTLKTGIGTSIAIIIAKQLGVQYAISAGIITILSIQNTKKQSVKIAFQRIGACILALFISSILFKIFGYNEIIFGVFLLIFIPVAVKVNVGEGIVVSSVLVTHLLIEKSVDIFWLRNELELMTIGIGVALLLNLYMPSIEGQIKQDQIYIEEKMKEILFRMAKALKAHQVSLKEDDLFNSLETRLYKARRRAYINLNNYFLLDASYYVQYMEMRMQQYETIKRMKEHFQRFFMTYSQTIMIAKFTEKVAHSLYEENTAEQLVHDLYILREEFKKMPLPSTREEFENRAMLFQFLNDMEQFLEVKHEFKQNLITKES